MNENEKDTLTAQAPAPKKSKFVTKDLILCVVVLTLIAVVAGVLLGAMNWLTYVDDEAVIMEKISKYYSVDSQNVEKTPERAVNDGSKNKVSACYTAKDGDGKVLGFVYRAVGSGAKDGTLELLVYVSEEGVIQEIEEYSQNETAGYFAKVYKAVKEKYVGVNITGIEMFELVKDSASLPGQIEQVSQATYTTKGFNNALNAVVYAFNNYEEAAV